MDRRILLVSYFFPPQGGAGVQRTTKFVKYLPSCGWAPTVLTVSNPSVPVFDPSLLGDVPPSARVVRARTWEPSYAAKQAVAASGNGASAQRWPRRWLKRAAHRAARILLQPDPQILWFPAAVRAGVRLLREAPHAAVMASGPPFSSFLVAAAISRRTGVPLVVEYRDEWDLSNCYWENKQFSRLSLAAQRRLQESVVRRAKLLIATSRPSARALEAIRNRSGSQARVACLYNGFDPDDFARPAPPPTKDAGCYRLVYVGTLWNLTTVAPLVEAVERLCRQQPELASRLELIFAGRRTPAEEQRLARLHGLPCRLRLLDYVNHAQAIDLMRSADGLCALLADVPGADRVVPAKIFEYMAAGRPILAIAPQGELHDLVRGQPRAACLSPNDIASICERLSGELRRHESADARALPAAALHASPYSRKRQAAELASLLEGVVGPEPVTVLPGRKPSWAAAGA